MKSSYSPRTPDMGRSRAFTLVEVLVVIAVISVLMAVLLPALSKARECAYLTGELTAGRELGQAHRMYAGDYNSYYMAGFASATMVAQRAVIAKDQKGEDLVLVQVDIDGARVAESLDGKGVTLDPGVHDVHLATVGQDPIDVRIVLAEGERERPVIVTFGKPAAATPRAPDDAKRGAPFGAFVVGGAGLLAVGVGAIFYGVGLGERSSAIASGCATTAACDAAKDSVRAKLVVGDLFAGIGVAAVVTGAVWAIVHYASAPAPKAGLSVDAGPVEGGARASVRGVF